MWVGILVSLVEASQALMELCMAVVLVALHLVALVVVGVRPLACRCLDDAAHKGRSMGPTQCDYHRMLAPRRPQLWNQVLRLAQPQQHHHRLHLWNQVLQAARYHWSCWHHHRLQLREVNQPLVLRGAEEKGVTQRNKGLYCRKWNT